MFYSLFLLYGEVEICQNILKFFKKTKRGLELVFPPHFLRDFWREIFLTLYSINWPNLIDWFYFLR